MTSRTPKRAQAREGDFKKRAAGDGDQRLGAVVGERTQARAQAGGEDHGFHLLGLSRLA